MEQKDNITVYLMSLQISKKHKLVYHLFSYFSLKCRLPMPEFSAYHAANEYYETKD